jgi:hypothetical protein
MWTLFGWQWITQLQSTCRPFTNVSPFSRILPVCQLSSEYDRPVSRFNLDRGNPGAWNSHFCHRSTQFLVSISANTNGLVTPTGEQSIPPIAMSSKMYSLFHPSPGKTRLTGTINPLLITIMDRNRSNAIDQRTTSRCGSLTVSRPCGASCCIHLEGKLSQIRRGSIARPPFSERLMAPWDPRCIPVPVR